MFLKQIYILAIFSNFYPGNNVSPISKVNSRQPFNDIYLYDCAFSGMTEYSYGSVVFYETKQPILMLIENCLFNNCFASQKGGAIYFFCEDGGSILSKNCVKDCSTPGGDAYTGQFAYVYCSFTKNNSVFLTTVMNCAPSSNAGRSPIYLYRGKIVNQDSNYSKGYGFASSSITIILPNEGKIQFTTVISTTSSPGSNIEVASGKIYIYRCNFIKNTASQALIHFNGNQNATIDLCNIINHNGYTFHLYSGHLLVVNSIIQSYTYTGSQPSTSNITFFSITIPQITHYQTAFCEAQVPYTEVPVYSVYPLSGIKRLFFALWFTMM